MHYAFIILHLGAAHETITYVRKNKSHSNQEWDLRHYAASAVVSVGASVGASVGWVRSFSGLNARS